MLIFSTVSAIALPIVYLFPFLYLWLKEGKSVYKIRDEVIDNKNVFIAKIVLIIILAIIFALTFPTKVIFHPEKVAIFAFVFVVIQLVTWLLIIDKEHDIQVKEFLCWVALIILGLLFIIVADETDKRTFEGTSSLVERCEVEHINSNGSLFFIIDGDELQVKSINDENIEIEISEIEIPYVEKITTWDTYSKRYEKEKHIYDDMSTCSESYTLYVSKTDLYK